MKKIFYHFSSLKNSRGEIPAVIVFAGLLLITLVIAAIVVGPRLIGSEPEIKLTSRLTNTAVDAAAALAVGSTFPLTVEALNNDHGVCALKVVIFQNNLGKEVFAATGAPGSWLKSWSHPWGTSLSGPAEASDLSSFGLVEGPAELHVEGDDCSLWHRRAVLTRAITIDLAPPAVAVTSSQHYINQGGAELATYSVSSDAVASGVKIGNNEFKGFLKPGAAPGSLDRFTIFVYSYDLPAGAPIEFFARDAAGNEGKAILEPAKFFPKEFRHREIPIDDKFIDTKVADIITHTPGLKRSGNNLNDFLMVNRELRKTDAAFLKELGHKSSETFFWKDAFRPLTNAAVEAAFADYRTYVYNGEKVDEQVHLGFDLAVVEHNPIMAAADGKVIFADYLGIYGNAIVIDHGYGIETLYAHLSSMDVKAGDAVTKDQKIANSGATGLAGGDHLHFSMLIQGVQTNPVEFWDQHWIEDHIYLRVNREMFGKLP
jgi:murein DD-endopeptidase MepM/ murein hydrolase activator NlpD